ncbi:hypothetical protein J6590_014411 [Homalodisca vitripennis]|nr:hypothetical protein J6590_014411 [Homalodisca vitripennis]
MKCARIVLTCPDCHVTPSACTARRSVMRVTTASPTCWSRLRFKRHQPAAPRLSARFVREPIAAVKVEHLLTVCRISALTNNSWIITISLWSPSSVNRRRTKTANNTQPSIDVLKMLELYRDYLNLNQIEQGEVILFRPPPVKMGRRRYSLMFRIETTCNTRRDPFTPILILHSRPVDPPFLQYLSNICSAAPRYPLGCPDESDTSDFVYSLIVKLEGQQPQGCPGLYSLPAVTPVVVLRVKLQSGMSGIRTLVRAPVILGGVSALGGISGEDSSEKSVSLPLSARAMSHIYNNIDRLERDLSRPWGCWELTRVPLCLAVERGGAARLLTWENKQLDHLKPVPKWAEAESGSGSIRHDTCDLRTGTVVRSRSDLLASFPLISSHPPPQKV